METINANYLKNVRNLFHYYKGLGDKAFVQISDEDINWAFNNQSNSIAVIVKHVAGNSLSRWTDFLNSDGEKDWRDRDDEFEGTLNDKTEMIAVWNKGWDCLFDAINALQEDDLMRIVYIRNEGHTVVEAINRQLAHLASHVGQIVFIAKMLTGDNWQSPTIARGKSKEFNKSKIAAEK